MPLSIFFKLLNQTEEKHRLVLLYKRRDIERDCCKRWLLVAVFAEDASARSSDACTAAGTSSSTKEHGRRNSDGHRWALGLLKQQPEQCPVKGSDRSWTATCRGRGVGCTWDGRLRRVGFGRGLPLQVAWPHAHMVDQERRRRRGQVAGAPWEGRGGALGQVAAAVDSRRRPPPRWKQGKKAGDDLSWRGGPGRRQRRTSDSGRRR